MPVNVKEPMYTVEQLALIKRLKESGITKQQVEYIYESYDRLDKELGTLYHIPVALAIKRLDRKIDKQCIVKPEESGTSHLELHTQALQQIQQLALNIAALRNSQANQSQAPPLTQLAPPCPPLSAAPGSAAVAPTSAAAATCNPPVNPTAIALAAALAAANASKISASTAADVVDKPASAAVPDRVAAAAANSLKPESVASGQTAAGSVMQSILPAADNSAANNAQLLQHILPLLNKKPEPPAPAFQPNNLPWSHGEFEESPELKEFVSQGEAACCEEIRNFVCRNGIKQHQVASLAGVCQTYVSRYMKGDFGDMSERSRKTIQKWYLAYRSDPAAVGRAASLAQMLTNAGAVGGMNNHSPGGVAVRRGLDVAMATNPAIAELFGGGGGVNYPRRERFVFRPAQLEILEERFISNSYPSYEERLDMAADCNRVLEEAVGRKLTDRESVSVSVISNWFANKRKDVKRAAREGGLDVSGMLMSRRGRPPRPLFPYNASIKPEPCDEMMMMGGMANDFSMSGTSPNADESYSDDDDQPPHNVDDGLLS